MNDELFYREIKIRSEKAWTTYENTYKKITIYNYYSNTSLPGIAELHKLVEDTNISFNMIFNLLKIKPAFDKDTQESIFNALEALENVSSQMEAIFIVSVQSGEQDTIYTLQDYIY
jgi:rubrerythrin